MVHVRVASALVPYEGWTARTRNVCAPEVSGPYDFGLVHPAQTVLVSKRHWNVAPCTGLENVKVALVSVVGADGPESIVGAGSGVIVHEKSLSGPVPREVRARTRNVWVPSARFVYVLGLVHDPKFPRSRRHSNVAPEATLVNANVAVRRSVVAVGDEVIVGAGGRLTSQV
jgi:hypothetical protein